MYDVVALGEILIDFTPSGTNNLGMQLFSRNPGGAPANVLAMNAKLGGKTAFIGKVGADDFGNFLINILEASNIDTCGLTRIKDVPTTLAFVQLNDKGDRTFSFYRNPGADICLANEDVRAELLTNCRIFHFGSVSLTDEPCRSATLISVLKAKNAGAIISYDPNYRPFLWKDEQIARSEILNALPFADIVKVSEEEMVLLTGESNRESGAKKLAKFGAALVIVTLGAEGAYYYSSVGDGTIPTYDVKTIDTTGAGDAFLGSILFCIAGKKIDEIKQIKKSEWDQYIAFANAAGSLTTMDKGAIPAMPNIKQIRDCQSHTKLLQS